MKDQIETQNRKPEKAISLDSVGITNFKTLLVINREERLIYLIPTIEASINLPSNIKGAHMSRICESIVEIINDERNAHQSVEELSLKVLTKLKEKHPYKRAYLKLNFDFFYETKTPVSKKKTFEVTNVTVESWIEEKQESLVQITVEYTGNTVCPHALENNPEGRTHIQRATGKLRVKGPIDQMPTFEQMVTILRESFPSETFSILKTEDEQCLIDCMYENPMFVEDVCRCIMGNTKESFKDKKLDLEVEVRSLESIHKHDVLAKSSGRTY
ncbi:MAG: GTP cyclohydrolase, FolE2/MptA family [Asgard group archaeon]|nr:GTP cyclohydrolase, FolE2/MptA family [Asgard group archaeon]